MKNIYKQTTVMSIILLFIGIGIHPAFAVDTNTPSSKSEKPVYTDGEVLENTNCFVMGMSSNTVPWYDNNLLGPFFLRGKITFGYCYLFGNIQSAEGWIYTSSAVDKWIHNGDFHGANGKFKGDIFLEYGYIYTGIKSFRGLVFVKGGTYYPDYILLYIGFAESVKINVTKG